MAAYTTEQQAFIVRALAECVSPETIVVEFARRWKDTACTVEDVAARLRRNLPAEWQPYFDEARAQFLDAPTDDQRVRVAILNRLAMSAESRGAPDMAAKYLEQIAKEKAGFYGGKGSGGGAPTPDGSDVPIRAITRTIVDPVVNDGDTNTRHSDTSGVSPATPAEAV